MVHIPAGSYHDPYRSESVLTFGDIEVFIGRYFRDQFGNNAKVYQELPSTVIYDVPVIRANRIGGMWVRPGILDNPMVDVDVWASTIEACKSTVSVARGLSAGLVNISYLGLVVTKVSELAGPVRRPETDENLSRIGFTLDLLVQRQVN